MRRWVCIVALLAGFAAEPMPPRRARRPPVAIERLLDEVRPLEGPAGAIPRRTMAWWQLH